MRFTNGFINDLNHMAFSSDKLACKYLAKLELVEEESLGGLGFIYSSSNLTLQT